MYSNKEVGSLFSPAEWESNNREGTEELPRDVVEGSKGVTSGLGHDNATYSSGAV
jgi:hypothetical protein